MQMGAQIAAHDWANSPLGPADTWPQTLKTSVRVMLASRYSMFLWWGENLVNIYNDSYVPHLGKRHPEALGQPASQVWSEIWDIVGPQAEAVFTQGNSTWNEEQLLVMERNGFPEETYFTFGYSPIRDEADTICGLLGICTDETARVLGRRRLRTLRDLGDRTSIQVKTAQDAVRAAAITLAENPHDIPFALVYLLSPDGKTATLAQAVRVEPGSAAAPVEILLPSGADIWGFSRFLETRSPALADVLTQKCGRITAGVWPEPIERAVVVPLAKPGVQDATAGFLVAGISPRLLFDEEYRAFLDLAGGHIASAIANARAYEEERQRAEALAQIDRAKTAFFSNVSHEFRTPLTLMLGPLESVLSKTEVLAPEIREQLAAAYRNSLRLLKLVNSLLDFSRIEAGRIQASYAPVDLSALTANLASNFRSAMQAAGLQLIVDCPTLPQPVYVDQEMWEKIVLNLLSNAFKFTFEGSVTVSVQAKGEFAEFCVADTGAGIPEHELGNIFKRFHRVEGARGRTFEGSGIGLALIQELARLHGGSVEVTSRLGQGSAFTVRIPFGTAHLPPDHISTLAPPSATALRAETFRSEATAWIANQRLTHTAQDAAASSVAPQPGARPRILLADDNADMREHIRRSLGDRCQITAVSDGVAALRQALEHMPDLLISDVMMPGMDGYELLRELRGNPRTRELPVILLSARAGEEARTEGLGVGADDYVTKPFTAKELTARVETRLHLVRMRREARVQFETLVNQAPIGIYLLDSDLRFRQVNPTALSTFSDIPHVIGRDFDEVMHILWPRRHADEIVQRFRHTLETGEPYAVPEFIQQRLDRGLTEYYEWRIDRMPLPDGRFGVVCYFRDISAQVEARDEISRSEKRFRAFVTASSDAIYRMNPDWSEMRLLQGHGFTAGTNPPPRDWLNEYVHPEDRERAWTAIREAIRTKSVFEIEHRTRRADGSLGWGVSRAVPVLDAHSEILEWLGTTKDVTSRRKAEALAHEAAERFRFMAESMPQKIFTARPNGEIDYFNRQWTEFTGQTLDQLQREDWKDLMHPEDAEETARLWRRSIETGEPFLLTHRFRRSDGAYRWHLSRAQAMRDRHGDINMWIGSNTEIHDQKLTEQELRRANADLEQFAYSASHDLQEPLRTVKIYSELLEKYYSAKLDGDGLQFLGFLQKAAARMEILVQDLLEYSRVTKLDPPEGASDSNQALAAALDNLGAAISESGAQLTWDPLPPVKIHGTHLEQLFQNLVGNAIKYRKQDRVPRIQISGEREDGACVFSVRDNGIGIEPQYKDLIFGLFKRLHSGEQYSGTGLGLAICQRIVEGYHGRIWVESEFGRGSTFFFSVPV